MQTWDDAKRVGIALTTLGQLIVTVLTVLILFCRHAIHWHGVVFVLECQFLISCLFSMPTGVACAWFSHRWFYRSTISVKLMTAITALIVDLVIVGWICVLLFESRI